MEWEGNGGPLLLLLRDQQGPKSDSGPTDKVRREEVDSAMGQLRKMNSVGDRISCS